MEAGTLLCQIPLELNPTKRHFHCPKPYSHLSLFPRSVTVTASLNCQRDYKGLKPKREWVADWVSKNDDVVRSLPIYVGGLPLLAVLFNRSVSSVAPVADARRVWESLSEATRCKSLVIVCEKRCLIQVGFDTASSSDSDCAAGVVDKLMEGSLYRVF